MGRAHFSHRDFFPVRHGSPPAYRSVPTSLSSGRHSESAQTPLGPGAPRLRAPQPQSAVDDAQALAAAV